jgi:hypothetical protein
MTVNLERDYNIVHFSLFSVCVGLFVAMYEYVPSFEEHRFGKDIEVSDRRQFKEFSRPLLVESKRNYTENYRGGRLSELGTSHFAVGLLSTQLWRWVSHSFNYIIKYK